MVDKSRTTDGVLGLFTPTTPLRPLIAELQQAGQPDEAIDILSPLPLSEPLLQKPIRLPLYVITIIAGIVGIGVGIFFAGGTAALYPLITGGKPIVARPVVGIISFETMMLLAIVTTFIAMVIKIRSAGRGAVDRDPRIDDGAIAIRVRIDPSGPSSASIEALFKEAGAIEVQRDGEGLGGGIKITFLICWLAAFGSFAVGCSKDMQEQASYQPQESPRLHSPAGSVPLESRSVALPSRKAEPLKRAARLFAINCAHCHGPDGEGDGPVAGYLTELPKNLRSPYVQTKSEPELYEILTHGRDAMPPFKGELSAEERWTLARYVRAMQKVKVKVEVEAEEERSHPE